jgi:hypothetical protein
VQEIADGIRAIIRPQPPALPAAADPTQWYDQQQQQDHDDQRLGMAEAQQPIHAAGATGRSDIEYAEVLEEEARRTRVERFLQMIAEPETVEPECVICNEPLYALSADTPCTLCCITPHSFHAKCLGRFWDTSSHRHCPLCRRDSTVAERNLVIQCARRAAECAAADLAASADAARQQAWEALLPAPQSVPPPSRDQASVPLDHGE